MGFDTFWTFILVCALFDWWTNLFIIQTWQIQAATPPAGYPNRHEALAARTGPWCYGGRQIFCGWQTAQHCGLGMCWPTVVITQGFHASLHMLRCHLPIWTEIGSTTRSVPNGVFIQLSIHFLLMLTLPMGCKFYFLSWGNHIVSEPTWNSI